MEIEQYFNCQLIGWLSYNPNFETRGFNEYPENRVCYIYPRYKLEGNRFIAIDSKKDFPTVGRIAVRVQGQDSAADVYNRYGAVVSFRLKEGIEVSANREANNYFTFRYNVNLGRDRSEVWIDRLDRNLLTEVINCNLTIDQILNQRIIDLPNRRFNNLVSNNVMVHTKDYKVYGPFEAIQQDDRIILGGLERNNYMAGVYPSHAVEPFVLSIADHTDTIGIQAVPSFKFNDANLTNEHIDLIEPKQLVDIFLEHAKLETEVSRANFREIKDYCNRILEDDSSFSLSEERSNKLKSILTTIFDRNYDSYRKLVEMILDDDKFRYHLIEDIVSASDNDLLSNLPPNVLNEISVELGERVSRINANNGVIPALNHAPTHSYNQSDAIKAITSIFFSNNNTVGFSYDNLCRILNKLYDDVVNIAEAIREYSSKAALFDDPNFDTNYVTTHIEYNPYFILNKISVALSLIKSSFAVNAILNNVLEAAKTLDDGEFNEDFDKLSKLNEKLLLEAKDLESHTSQIIELDIVDTMSNLINVGQFDITDGTLSSQFKDQYERILQSVLDIRFGKNSIDCTSLNDEQGQSLNESIGQEIIANHEKLEKINEELKVTETQLAELAKQKEKLQKEVKKLDTSLDSRKKDSAKLTKLIEAKIEEYKKERLDDASRALELIDNSIANSLIGTQSIIVPQAASFNGVDASLLGNNSSALFEAASGETSIASPNSSTTHDVAKFDMSILYSGNKAFEAEEIADHVRDYIKRYGGRELSRNDVLNYLICITQGFITTFAGEPGTGKTSLCNLLSCALGLSRNDSNNRFIEVSVERGWNSLKDFIGYYNPITRRLEKSNSDVFDAFNQLNTEATQAPDGLEYSRDKIAPYLILLDEANLSPIEHYWAGFFRSCDFNSFSNRTINLGGNANWNIPEHLRFLATVNFDHTTEELSSRFLDRSWVITLQPTYKNVEVDTLPTDSSSKMFSFGDLMNAFALNKELELDENIQRKWSDIQNAFACENTSLPISPRNLKMVENYCLVASACMEQGSKNRLYPIDYAVAQKILPTINGSGERYKNLIDELVNICDETSMPLCYNHVKRMQRNGGADLGFYQFFSR